MAASFRAFNLFGILKCTQNRAFFNLIYLKLKKTVMLACFCSEHENFDTVVDSISSSFLIHKVMLDSFINKFVKRLQKELKLHH
jgi:hypothetical protein